MSSTPSKSIDTPAASRSRGSTSLRRAGLALTLLLLVGASAYLARRPEKPAPRRAYPVTGRLLVGNQPADNASLAFHPIGPDTKSVACPVAITQADGSFRLTTFTPGDGAPPGEYAVTILWPDPEAPFDECLCPNLADHDQLCGDYTDAHQSPLRATISPHDNTLVLHATPSTPRARYEQKLRRLGIKSLAETLRNNDAGGD